MKEWINGLRKKNNYNYNYIYSKVYILIGA